MPELFRNEELFLYAATPEHAPVLSHRLPAYCVALQGMYTLKKSLGQHFLKDENIIRAIVAALKEQPFTQLLRWVLVPVHLQKISLAYQV